MHAADHRYGDDAHHYGGCLLASEMLLWVTVMLPMNARLPPVCRRRAMATDVARTTRADGLAPQPGTTEALSHTGVQHHGLHAGVWCPGGDPPDPPDDQREEGARCPTLDPEPLAEGIELLGRPRVHLRLAADRPVAIVMARVCVVLPDGTSVLLSHRALNLTHRNSDRDLEPLVPGEEAEVSSTSTCSVRPWRPGRASGARCRRPTGVAAAVAGTRHAHRDSTGAASWIELPSRNVSVAAIGSVLRSTAHGVIRSLCRFGLSSLRRPR